MNTIVSVVGGLLTLVAWAWLITAATLLAAAPFLTVAALLQ